MRHQKRTSESENRSADNVGQIVRTDVHPRKANEDRNGKAPKADAPVCKKQRTKKSGRSSHVPGRKRVVF